MEKIKMFAAKANQMDARMSLKSVKKHENEPKEEKKVSLTINCLCKSSFSWTHSKYHGHSSMSDFNHNWYGLILWLYQEKPAWAEKKQAVQSEGDEEEVEVYEEEEDDEE